MNGRDARRDDIVELIHGRRVADPYRWLEDPASVATRDWLAQQNALTDAYFDGCAVRQTMLTELAELSGVAAPALPTYAGGRAFLTRQPPGSDTPRLYVQDRDGRERVLVDPPEGAMLGRWHAAPHGRLLAYQITSGGKIGRASCRERV